MRLLADENVGRSVVLALRKAGHDIADVFDLGIQGGTDQALTLTALTEGRIIITNDKDFAYIHFRQEHAGVILLRFQHQHPVRIAETLLRVLQSLTAEKLKGNLVVINEHTFAVHKRPTEPSLR